jgi:hypothetical protein
MSYITNIDTTILPYNDAEMKYDIDRRQYVLTIDGFERWSGLKLSSYTDSPEEGEAFMFEISDDVYEYIYSISNINSIDLKRFYIAKGVKIRTDFKKALMTHARYGLRSGGNLLKDMHGVNIEKGKAIHINSIRGEIGIAPQTQSILYRIGLMYSGYMINTHYEDDGSY